jgi:hypothetical protein
MLILFSFGSTSSVLDASGMKAPADARLELPVAYVLSSPLSRMLDAVSLLSVPQDISLAATLIVIVVLWRLTVSGTGWRSIAQAARSAGLVVLLVGGLILTAIAAPRPMASLSVFDPRIVRVDFHSHTNSSHDGRSGFTAERNRAWHRDGGFDAAYVSDHRGLWGADTAFAGAAAGETGNTTRSGDRTVLLTAIEARHLGIFIVTLGMTAADSGLIDRDWHLVPGGLRSGRLPASIAVLPGPLVDVTARARDEPPHLVAIELVNGAPRGLGQLDKEEPEIRKRASELNLAMVASTNAHGWGRTVPGWSLVEIDGWRSLSPDSLGVLIEHTLRNGRTAAVQVVQRVRPRTHGVTLALTVPVLALQTLTTLTFPERLAWLGWIWVVVLLRAVIPTWRPTARQR